MTTKYVAPDFMAPDVLKPLLRLSRRRSVSCAICFTTDHEPLILLNRRYKPRKALLALRHAAKDLGIELSVATIRFGHARVNGASDSTKVVLTVNRASQQSLRHALLAAVRPAGFQRVEIVVDEELDNAPASDEAEEEYNDDELEDDEDDAPKVAPAPKPGELGSRRRDEAPDAAALRARLMHLIKELIPVLGPDAAGKQRLLDLARRGQASLKSGDMAGAAASIEALRVALHPA